MRWEFRTAYRERSRTTLRGLALTLMLLALVAGGLGVAIIVEPDVLAYLVGTLLIVVAAGVMVSAIGLFLLARRVR